MNILVRIGRKGRSLYALSATTLFLILLNGFIAETGPAKEGPSSNNAVITEYGPALAIRGAGCITCHAEVYSPFITDFGFGDVYFFGNPKSGSKVGPFNGNIYGDFIAEQNQTGWSTARFHKDIIVPAASIDFDLKDTATGGLKDQPSYQDAFRASSLAGYLQELENSKANPSQVIEKKKVYIGAPDTVTLEMRFGMEPGDSTDFKYVQNDGNVSRQMKGIELSESGKYYTNTSDIICDGDLFIRGILFLNKPSIRTGTGCRMYATDPVFLQGSVSFESAVEGVDHTNLQLVSSQAIFLGTGQKKCGAEGDPLSSRLLQTPALTSLFTRYADRRNIKPAAFMQDLYDEASMIPLEDSSCHDDTLSFSRMLLNAPVIHSRYSGRFRGVVIAEFALFWQGKSSYEFDPIFKEIPVLPILKESDYLLVEN